MAPREGQFLRRRLVPSLSLRGRLFFVSFENFVNLIKTQPPQKRLEEAAIEEAVWRLLKEP